MQQNHIFSKMPCLINELQKQFVNHSLLSQLLYLDGLDENIFFQKISIKWHIVETHLPVQKSPANVKPLFNI